jgi:hypothetical protein
MGMRKMEGSGRTVRAKRAADAAAVVHGAVSAGVNATRAIGIGPFVDRTILVSCSEFRAALS